MNTVNPLLRVLVLWIVLLICMMLHFNYHVSKIFYGINVVRPGTDGTIPFMAQVLKNVYYHFPMIFIVALLYLKSKWFKLSLFVISIVYSLSHVVHLRDEFMKPSLDWAQVPLLSLTLVFSVLLNKASWDYFKTNE
jgi:hypothetical protein